MSRAGLLDPLALATALALAVALGCGSQAPPSRAPEPARATVPSASPAPELPFPDEAPEPPAPSAAGAPEVTIKLLVDASRKAHVFWGRKDLGLAPLQIRRPRGSGPLDLLVSAPGFLPLHTRAFTDRDDTLSLRLYDEEAARGLLGHPIATVGSPVLSSPRVGSPGRAKIDSDRVH